MTEDALYLSETRGRVKILCRVVPRSSRNAVAGELGGALKIALTAPPVDGKANAALCEFLADLLDVPKSAAQVVGGRTSRNKTVEVQGTTLENAIRALTKK